MSPAVERLTRLLERGRLSGGSIDGYLDANCHMASLEMRDRLVAARRQVEARFDEVSRLIGEMRDILRP